MTGLVDAASTPSPKGFCGRAENETSKPQGEEPLA